MRARDAALAMIIGGALLTVCDFGAFRDSEMMRTIPKYLGQLGVLAGIAAYLSLIRLSPGSAPTRSQWLWSLIFAGPLAAITLGELANLPQQAVMPILRWVSAVGLGLVVLRLDAAETRLALAWVRRGALWVSLIGIVFFVFQFDKREKFPVIELYSTKSIVFEQNIYGIIAYFGLCAWWLDPPSRAGRLRRWVEVAVFTVAGLLSYYKTTILLGFLITLLMAFGVYALAAGAAVMAGLGVYFMDELLLLSQIDTNGVSSGRFELWSIGIEAWQQHPVLGIGESGIMPAIARHIVRDPPFTTFHSIFVDTVAAGGLVGLASVALTLLMLAWRLGPRFLQYGLVLAPAAFNTFYVGSPNFLGVASLLFFQCLCLRLPPRGSAPAPAHALAA